MIKYREHIIYEMERYPEKCNECPAFNKTPYRCHNEQGFEAHCKLGYMGGDMRDFNGYKKYPGCNMEHSARVVINKILANK